MIIYEWRRKCNWDLWAPRPVDEKKSLKSFSIYSRFRICASKPDYFLVICHSERAINQRRKSPPKLVIGFAADKVHNWGENHVRFNLLNWAVTRELLMVQRPKNEQVNESSLTSHGVFIEFDNAWQVFVPICHAQVLFDALSRDDWNKQSLRNSIRTVLTSQQNIYDAGSSWSVLTSRVRCQVSKFPFNIDLFLHRPAIHFLTDSSKLFPQQFH